MHRGKGCNAAPELEEGERHVSTERAPLEAELGQGAPLELQLEAAPLEMTGAPLWKQWVHLERQDVREALEVEARSRSPPWIPWSGSRGTNASLVASFGCACKACCA